MQLLKVFSHVSIIVKMINSNILPITHTLSPYVSLSLSLSLLNFALLTFLDKVSIKTNNDSGHMGRTPTVGIDHS